MRNVLGSVAQARAKLDARREALDITATAFEQLADRLDRRIRIFGELYEPGTLTTFRVLRYEVRMVARSMRAASAGRPTGGGKK